MRTRISQAEIARVTGIPRSTVSYALNPRLRAKLRPEIRQRVIETAKQLSYRPDLYAQVMRKGRSGIIGVVHYLSLLQVSAERIYYVSRAVQAAGYRLNNESLATSDDCSSVCSSLIDARVEGLIFATVCPTFDALEVQRFRAAQIPIVMLGAHRCPDIPLVCCDFRQGFRELTEHLLSLGHKRFVFVSSMEPERCDENLHWTALERFRGFCDAIESVRGHVVSQPDRFPERTNGIVGEVVVETGPDTLFDPFEPGRVAMKKLLARDRLPDVVVCTNDDWAIGAMAVCAEAGVRVPEDVALTGFDNTSAGRICRVPLTSVAQPTETMAGRAVELLVHAIRREIVSTGDELIKLPCQLVARESCGSRAKREA